jgi:hypothetical protein
MALTSVMIARDVTDSEARRLAAALAAAIHLQPVFDDS